LHVPAVGARVLLRATGQRAELQGQAVDHDADVDSVIEEVGVDPRIGRDPVDDHLGDRLADSLFLAEPIVDRVVTAGLLAALVAAAALAGGQSEGEGGDQDEGWGDPPGELHRRRYARRGGLDRGGRRISAQRAALRPLSCRKYARVPSTRATPRARPPSKLSARLSTAMSNRISALGSSCSR